MPLNAMDAGGLRGEPLGGIQAQRNEVGTDG